MRARSTCSLSMKLDRGLQAGRYFSTFRKILSLRRSGSLAGHSGFGGGGFGRKTKTVRRLYGSRHVPPSSIWENENAEPDSGANGGGRTPFASSCVEGRRHRSLFTFGVSCAIVNAEAQQTRSGVSRHRRRVWPYVLGA